MLNKRTSKDFNTVCN